MASKKKTATVALIGMAAIVAATQDASKGFALVGTDEANKLASEGLVEIAPEGAVQNVPAGQAAVRATQKGVDSVATASAPTAEDAGKPSFVIEDNIAIPAVSGRGGRIGSVYPFDKLNVGQSFFVAKAAKNLASTVSSANARYAEVVPGETRKDRKGNDVPKTKFTRHFIVRSVEGGSRIWRKA